MPWRVDERLTRPVLDAWVRHLRDGGESFTGPTYTIAVRWPEQAAEVFALFWLAIGEATQEQ